MENLKKQDMMAQNYRLEIVEDEEKGGMLLFIRIFLDVLPMGIRWRK